MTTPPPAPAERSEAGIVKVALLVTSFTERVCMSVGLAGIRIENASITRETDSMKVQGDYALMSTTDKVLAKQNFNGYGGIEVKMSPASVKALDSFVASIKDDINSVIGLEGGAS